MAHLPNELWLNIISDCDCDKDLWLNLRVVNHQIQSCVEQYFAEKILPQLTVSLPLALPTYDARNPIRGEATFTYCTQQSRPDREYGDDGRVYYDLGPTIPAFYGRWSGMRDVHGGWMRPSVEWILRVKGEEGTCRVKDARAVSEGVGKDENGIEFEWKATLRAFYKSSD